MLKFHWYNAHLKHNGRGLMKGHTWAALPENLSEVSEQAMPKPACPATESGYKIEISRVASLDMILITQTLVRLRGCASWSVHLLFACNKVMFISRRAHFKLDTSDLGRFSINLPKACSSSSSLSCSRCFFETSRAFPAEKKTREHLKLIYICQK